MLFDVRSKPYCVSNETEHNLLMTWSNVVLCLKQALFYWLNKAVSLCLIIIVTVSYVQ